MPSLNNLVTRLEEEIEYLEGGKVTVESVQRLENIKNGLKIIAIKAKEKRLRLSSP